MAQSTSIIKLNKVLHQLRENEKPHDVVAVQCNRTTGKAGVFLKMNQVRLVQRKKRKDAADTNVGTKIRKDPNHRANGTINLYSEATGETRKVHIRLITHFDNIPVRW